MDCPKLRQQDLTSRSHLFAFLPSHQGDDDPRRPEYVAAMLVILTFITFGLAVLFSAIETGSAMQGRFSKRSRRTVKAPLARRVLAFIYLLLTTDY